MNTPGAVLFDLDGVLVDSRIPFARSVNAALAAAGQPTRAEAELHRYIGPPLHQTFAELLDDPSLIEACVECYRARYRERAARETVVFPGIGRLLAALPRQIPLLVATSKPQALAQPLLQALALSDHFAAVVGPDLSSPHEPKSETLGRALELIAHSQAPVMVGDRHFDIGAAHHHGIPGIGVLWGIGSEEELRSAGADALVSSPAELAALLAA